MRTQYALVAAALALTSCGPPVWLGTFGSSGGALGAWSTTAWSCSSGVSESADGRITTVTFRRRGQGDLSTGTGPRLHERLSDALPIGAPPLPTQSPASATFATCITC